jgi:hypothetical protein
LAGAARRLLEITFDEQASWRDPTGYRPLRNWIDAVEDLGVFVFANIQARDPLDRVDEVALTFGVTPRAAAVTTTRRGLLQSCDADAVIARIRDRGARARGSGGDYYWSQIGRLGPSFTRLALTALG